MKPLLFMLLITMPLSVPVTSFAEQKLPAATEAKTVWVDAHFGFRKKSGAKGINKIHKDMETNGWSFADMELYNENGDLEGFFITYTRVKKPEPGKHNK